MSHKREKFLPSMFPNNPAIALIILGITLLLCGFAQKLADAQIAEVLPAGPMQAKATTSCLECHEARIILQQRLRKAAWTKDVDKMMKWGAVVDPADHDALIDYLSANFSPDKPAYEPQRTATDKSGAKGQGSSERGQRTRGIN